MEIIKEAARGNLEAVTDLIAQGVNVNIQNELGETALIEAVNYNHLEVVRILLDANADVNIRKRKRKMNALMIAGSKGYLDVVEILIASNADINATDIGGLNVLSLSPLDNIELINMLIGAGVDIDTSNDALIDFITKQNKNQEKEVAKEKIKPITLDSVIGLLKEVSLMAKEQKMETRDILLAYQVLELRRQSDILSLSAMLNDENALLTEEKLNKLLNAVEEIPSYIENN